MTVYLESLLFKSFKGKGVAVSPFLIEEFLQKYCTLRYHICIVSWQ